MTIRSLGVALSDSAGLRRSAVVSQETGLSEDAPLQANGQVPAGLAGNCDEPWLGGVPVLAMTAPRAAEYPTVLLDQPNGLADLHPRSILSSAVERS